MSIISFQCLLLLLSRALLTSWVSMVTWKVRFPKCLGKPERDILKKASVIPSTTEGQGRTRCPDRSSKESRTHNRIWDWMHIRIQLIQLWSNLFKVTRPLGGKDSTRTQVSCLSTRLSASLPTAPNPGSKLGAKENSISKLSLLPLSQVFFLCLSSYYRNFPIPTNRDRRIINSIHPSPSLNNYQLWLIIFHLSSISLQDYFKTNSRNSIITTF